MELCTSVELVTSGWKPDVLPIKLTQLGDSGVIRTHYLSVMIGVLIPT